MDWLTHIIVFICGCGAAWNISGVYHQKKLQKQQENIEMLRNALTQCKTELNKLHATTRQAS